MINKRKSKKKYIGKFLEEDYTEFENHFLSLLKDYKRKTQRLDKIIKQSDKQQFQMLKANEELEEYKLKLENSITKDKILFQKSRQAQMGEMISMIAHQWRQPLTAISGTIVGMQLKQRDEELDLTCKEQLDKFLAIQDTKLTRITDQVQALSSTIDDFRDFFKPNKVKSTISIHTLIEKALSLISSNLIDRGIKITTNFSININLSVYPNEIIQVILNILQNCKDNFLQKDIQESCINIETNYDTNNNPFISIEDNGGGIAIDILPKIFDPYFSTKDEKNGTGLGLYMSKKIIEEHNNGIIKAINTQDGVSFIISWQNV